MTADAACQSKLNAVCDKINFSSAENETLNYWSAIKAFEISLERNKNKPIYTFYDGPPFATGLPHYGHLLAGTIKDIVTRYAAQTGHYVERRFGWDCHGLPIEYEIDQKLGIRSRDDVLRMGIDKYNSECRSIVQRYTSEWRSTVTRMGRWIDFDHDYKTMDTSFMESVWWVFSELYKKNLVYRGYKVMPYSTACTTPLSNFEAGQNYKDVKDPTAIVEFKCLDETDVSFIAWTTTPWTLPSNLALCVNKNMDYVQIRDSQSGKQFILAQTRLEELYPIKKTKKDKNAKTELEYDIVKTFKGADIVDRQYIPPFPYFLEQRHANGAFRVLEADFVTDDSGTGIVHTAPAFGEDDYNACLQAGIIKKDQQVICPVDDDGKFTDQVTDFKGRYVKEADKDILKMLKEKGLLVRQSQIDHSYPHCWRSETPLIYRAVPSWFVRVEAIKDQLLIANDLTQWVPSFVKEKRFHNWLRDARDWAISRNRYWGTPLPIWISEDGKEIQVISSIKQLEELSGVSNITDLHKDKIDHITIPSKQGKGLLRRTPEVFDCWFESGSMPYAQQHYPFENEEYFKKGFPADFIAEGLDQTRGWFYTLMVISTALFEKPAFKNVIVNGLVLASDGKKMSKRLKNYPDPMSVVEKYGADALRIYLIDSPVVRAEPLKFKEEGVHDVIKSIFLPWFHAYRFLVENILRFEKNTGNTFTLNLKTHFDPQNVMDKWIMASLQSLIAFVREEMQFYRLYTVVPRLLSFIEQLTNWYVRTNRKRLKGGFGENDTILALSTLSTVLLSLCRLMSPFSPFFVELIYSNLKLILPQSQQFDSIHYEGIPVPEKSYSNPIVETQIRRMQQVVELGRAARQTGNLTLKKPSREFIIVHQSPEYLESIKSLESYIRDECNIREGGIKFSSDEDAFILLRANSNRRSLGQRLGKKAPSISQQIQKMTHEQVKKLQTAKSTLIDGETITLEDVEIVWEFQGDKTKYSSMSNDEVLVLLNIEQDASLTEEQWAREITRGVQKLRKQAQLVPTDEIEVFYQVLKENQIDSSNKMSTNLTNSVINQSKFITETIGRQLHSIKLKPKNSIVLAQFIEDIEGQQILLQLVRKTVVFLPSAMTQFQKGNNVAQSTIELLQQHIQDKEWSALQKLVKENNEKLNIRFDGRDYTLLHRHHFFFHVSDLIDEFQKRNNTAI